jgi:hypothetical protein
MKKYYVPSHNRTVTVPPNFRLDYTRNELKTEGWATIGGRIEDYKNMLENGVELEDIYMAIHEDYGDENADSVYRGLLVISRYGIDYYYNNKKL